MPVEPPIPETAPPAEPGQPSPGQPSPGQPSAPPPEAPPHPGEQPDGPGIPDAPPPEIHPPAPDIDVPSPMPGGDPGVAPGQPVM